MLNETEVLRLFIHLERETLRLWIDRGWVLPDRGPRGFRFKEVDVARIRLVHEFSTELGLTNEAMDLVLPLIDQLHGLRSQLRLLAEAVDAEPDDVKRRIAKHMEGSRSTD